MSTIKYVGEPLQIEKIAVNYNPKSGDVITWRYSTVAESNLSGVVALCKSGGFNYNKTKEGAIWSLTTDYDADLDVNDYTSTWTCDCTSQTKSVTEHPLFLTLDKKEVGFFKSKLSNSIPSNWSYEDYDVFDGYFTAYTTNFALFDILMKKGQNHFNTSVYTLKHSLVANCFINIDVFKGNLNEVFSTTALNSQCSSWDDAIPDYVADFISQAETATQLTATTTSGVIETYWRYGWLKRTANCTVTNFDKIQASAEFVYELWPCVTGLYKYKAT